MATFEYGGSFLPASGAGKAGGVPSGGQDELVPFRASETITLSTAGTTTDSAEYLLPANSIILAVTSTITTALAGSGVSGYTVGEATTAARFASVTATAAGSVSTGAVALKGSISTDATGPTQASAAKVRITATGGTPTSGAIRVTVFGLMGRPVAA